MGVLGAGRLAVWEKMSRLVAALPALYPLTRSELGRLWEASKEGVALFCLGELVRPATASLHHQLDSLALVVLEEVDPTGALVLAPPLTLHLFSRALAATVPVSLYMAGCQAQMGTH